MMPTDEVQAAEEAPPEICVPFMGREIWVKMPRPEQVLVWQRTVQKLGNSGPDTSWTGPEVMKALERLRMIIDSILLNRADVEWLDDRFLDGTAGFRELTPFLNDVITAFSKKNEQDAPNRETRRATKPAKKATRKKVTS